MIILNGGSYYPESEEIDKVWISKIKKDELIAFIPSGITRSQEEYFAFFKENMSEYGLSNIVHVDLYKSWEKAREAKVIYIGGGNACKLIDIMRKSGFAEFLKQNHQTRIVLGNSAGAAVLGLDIRTSDDEDIIGLDDMHGLGLVNYSIFPHYSQDKRVRVKELLEELNHPILGIPETSALIVDGDEITVNGIEIFRK